VTTTYLQSVGRHLQSRYGRRVLITLAAVMIIHLAYRAALLPAYLAEVKALWESSKYHFLVRSPAIEALDFLFRPVLVWIAVGVLFCLLAPLIEKRDAARRHTPDV